MRGKVRRHAGIACRKDNSRQDEGKIIQKQRQNKKEGKKERRKEIKKVRRKEGKKERRKEGKKERGKF